MISIPRFRRKVVFMLTMAVIIGVIFDDIRENSASIFKTYQELMHDNPTIIHHLEERNSSTLMEITNELKNISQRNNNERKTASSPVSDVRMVIKKNLDNPINKKKRLSNAKQWKPNHLPSHLQHADQADPALISEIKKNWILPPDNLPLKLRKPERTYFAQSGQDQFLDDIFKKRRSGFYIESGAYDGEHISNTLFFERERGWDGLLIEPDPNNFRRLKRKHRNALMLNACLSPRSTADVLNFTIISSYSYLSRLDDVFYTEKVQKHIKSHVGEVEHEHIPIQCFPLYSIIAALDEKHIDLLSLDIEGSELEVLGTLPMDKLDIDVFVIETCTKDCSRRFKNLTLILEPHGFNVKLIPGNGHDIVMTTI